MTEFQAKHSRRQFLARAATAAASTLAMSTRAAWAVPAVTQEANSRPIDPRVAAIVAKTIGIDTHNHIDVALAAGEMPGPEIDLRGEMKKSGLSAICMTFATDYQPGNAYERFRNALASMDRALTHSRMKRALTAADIRAAHASRQPAAIQSVEGSHFLEGHLERLEEAYHHGMRHVGILHDSDASVPLGDVYTNPPRFGGLTPFGASVVKECNRLGILIDLAHCDMHTTEMALKLTTTPVIISHTGPDWRLGSDERMAQMMRPRLISREQAKIVAAGGGLVGVWTHLAATPLEYAENLRALADVIGVDHVCIGTDTKLTPSNRRPGGPGGGQGSTPPPPRPGERTNFAWEGQSTGFYYTVVEAMLAAGFTPEEIAKIGGENYLRVFAAAVRG